jgi:NtrC-family two-component system sensor histidine kinase KinB
LKFHPILNILQSVRIPFFNSLRFKVGFGYIVLLLINIAVTTWAMYNFGRQTSAFNSILSENYPTVITLETMARTVELHERALTLILNKDFNNGWKMLDSAKIVFYQTFDKVNEYRDIPDAGFILDDIRSTYKGYILVSDSLIGLALRNRLPAAKAFYGNIVRPFSQRLSENCFWLIDANQNQIRKVAQQTRERSDEAVIAVLFAAIVALTLSILTMVQFTKRIIQPAERLAETVHQIGRGRLDLKIDIETNDEVGELSREFNKMTERLRKFEELNIQQIISEKQKSETIVENITDAIIVCDSEATIQMLNHSAEELLRLRGKDVLGKPIGQCISDRRLLAIFRSPSDQALAAQPYLQFSARGRQVYLRPRVTRIPARQGTGGGGVVLILQDVTQFKELDKMKSDFMAAVSHEFRTPLTSINMSVDILRQRLLGPLTEQQEDLLEASKQDCERLTKLVRELLQLSRLESGTVERREEQIDVRKVIDSALGPLRLPFREKNVELKASFGPDLPPLLGDEQQLSWVISNLVNNALRYTDSGGTVEVAACREGETILVTVRDTGRGIPGEYLEKIFDKFVQVKQTLDSTPGSVGLGLAIAKEIVEMYGGKIWVESEVNKGSLFSIQLPLRQEEPA